MVPSSAGAVVIIAFPFSDLTQTKLRPAIVIADAERGAWVLCQVTSNAYFDLQAISLAGGDFASGSLRVTSYARPGKLFTANQGIIVSEVGRLNAPTFARVVQAIVNLLQSGLPKPNTPAS